MPLVLTEIGVRVAGCASHSRARVAGPKKIPTSALFDWLESRIIRKSGPGLGSDICQITVKLEGMYLTV